MVITREAYGSSIISKAANWCKQLCFRVDRNSVIAGLIICASLTVVDGDMVKCDGRNMPPACERRPVRQRHRYAGDRITCEVIEGAESGADRQGQKATRPTGWKGLRVRFSGAVDNTQTHRPLVSIYRTNGKEIGKKLLWEGFAREWRPKRRNDLCN